MTSRVIVATSLRKITRSLPAGDSTMFPIASTESICPVGLTGMRWEPISRSPEAVITFC
jgi:hypothetical protein